MKIPSYSFHSYTLYAGNFALAPMHYGYHLFKEADTTKQRVTSVAIFALSLFLTAFYLLSFLTISPILCIIDSIRLSCNKVERVASSTLTPYKDAPNYIHHLHGDDQLEVLSKCLGYYMYLSENSVTEDPKHRREILNYIAQHKEKLLEKAPDIRGKIILNLFGFFFSNDLEEYDDETQAQQALFGFVSRSYGIDLGST